MKEHPGTVEPGASAGWSAGVAPEPKVTPIALSLASTATHGQVGGSDQASSVALTFVLAAAQWALHDFTWHDLPGFTDAPFILSPPGRWLLARMSGGSRGPAARQQATADILTAFLRGPLTRDAADIAAAASAHHDVRGGAVPQPGGPPGTPQ